MKKLHNPNQKPYHYPALICVLAFQFILSCSSNQVVTSVPNLPKDLLVNYTDVSGTAIGGGWPNPPLEFYQDQVAYLESHQGGTLIVMNICLKIPREVSVNIEPLLAEPNPMEAGEDETRRIMAHNQMVKHKNAENKSRFFSQLNGYIINYNPDSTLTGDLSFIDINLHSLNKKLKEPAYSNHTRHVFIYSDLLNEPGGDIKQPASASLIDELNTHASYIYACHPIAIELENAAIKKLQAIRLSSYNDLIPQLNSLTAKN